MGHWVQTHINAGPPVVTQSLSPPPPAHCASPWGGQNPKQPDGNRRPQAYQNAAVTGEVLAPAALPARTSGTSGVPEQQPQQHGQAAPQRARHRRWAPGGARGALGPGTVQELWGEK